MDSFESVKRVLFIGLGAMGGPMAARVAQAGYKLLVCDRDEDRAQEIANRLSGRFVSTREIQSAVAEVDAVVLMLPNSVAVEEVLIGKGGLLELLPRGSLVIDMGSSRPSSTTRLAQLASTRGISLIDAPVSGGVAKANVGELSIMVGTDKDGFIRCGKFLSCMGNDVTLVGPSGSGHAMKALNNMLSAIGFAAAAEVLAIGAKMGLDPRVMLKVLNRSSGSNNATQAKIEKFVLSRKFDSGFALSLMLKDLRTAVDLAHETMTPIPIGASCLEEWIAAGSTMPNNADHTHIAAYIEAQAGVKLQ